MKSINKRFAKIRIVSKMVQYSDETDATEALTEEDITEESSTLTTDCTIADKGDKLEIVEKDGVIELMPVAVYPKKYLDELRSEINEAKAKIAAGEQPVFDTVDALFEALDGADE